MAEWHSFLARLLHWLLRIFTLVDRWTCLITYAKSAHANVSNVNNLGEYIF